jgi:C4-dicarboxylate transporter DctM subunit
VTLALFAVFGLLLAAGMPIAFALATSGFGFLLLLNGSGALAALPTIAYDSLSSFTFTAIPLYILLANVLIQSGISRDLYRMIQDWVGHWPGGLAIATVLFCAGFSAISGSSVATAATVGMLAVPEMLRAGYDRRFVFGLVAAGGTLGILIPPSLFMILYAALTDESAGKLFIAGVVPGLLLTALFLLYAVFFSWRRGYRGGERAPWSRRWTSTRQALWGACLPVLVVGGIYTGAFTPTEAAAVGALVSLALAAFLGRLTGRGLRQILLDTVRTTSMIFLIIVAAILFGHVVTLLKLPQSLIGALAASGIGPLAFILAVCVIFLFLGDFLEVVSITLITLPIIYPLLKAMQIDPIWFAVIMTIMMEFALITPPVGLNLFVITGLQPDTTWEEVFRGTLPFMALMALALALVIAFPSLSTWLPRFVR